MSTLEAALAWAARGFRVFPIRAWTKDQPLFEGWQHHATTDAEQIRQWWISNGVVHDHNIGCLTTGMVVVDGDPKKDGINSALLKLGLGFDTLIVRTPTEGLHWYFAGPDSANSVGKLAAGVDVRSHNGYVLAPGSKRLDGAYSLEVDLPLATVPDSVRAGLRAPEERQEQIVAEGLELDRPDAIALALSLLQRAEPAIEGMGGDAHTYETACKVRDLGVSDEVCWSLMLEEWNPRCEPPWDADELRVKIQNAYDSATGQAGAKHPALQLDGIQVPEIVAPATILPPAAGGFGNAIGQMSIPPRDWRMARTLLRGLVTILTAPGGASKSTVVLTIAAHKALGRDFAGLSIKKGKSVIYNSEDDLEEQSRRLNAICSHYGFDFDEVRSQIYLLDRNAISLKLTENNPPVVNSSHVNFLIEACSDPDCDFLALDPFVSLLSTSEDDNQAMDYVMDVVKIVAREAKVAVMLVDHSKKPQGAISQAGDMASGRGASSKSYAARIFLTLTTASKEDCEQHNIPEEDRHAYVRLDDAKMNMALASGKPLWLKKHGVKLFSGDEVGVVAPVDLSVNDAFLRQQMASVFLAEMTGKGAGWLALQQAVAVLQAADPLYARLSALVVKSRIARFLAQPVEIEGNRVSCVNDGKVAKIVLE